MGNNRFCIDCGIGLSLRGIPNHCRSCAGKIRMRNINSSGKNNPNFNNKWTKEQKIKQSILTKKIMKKLEIEQRLSGKNHWNYKKGETLKENNCSNCGIEIYYKSVTCRKCYLKLNTGIFHPNYIKNLDRDYPIEFNNKLKESIRKRDNYICQECTKTQLKNGRKLDVHHIDYNKKNLNKKNLISLCQSCNLKVNYNRKYWISYFENKLKENLLCLYR